MASPAVLKSPKNYRKLMKNTETQCKAMESTNDIIEE